MFQLFHLVTQLSSLHFPFMFFLTLDQDLSLNEIAMLMMSTRIGTSNRLQKRNVLSDGNIISVGAECFRCESVFQPSIIGKDAYRIHDTSFQNVMKCDVDIRVNLYANVVLPSSTTMFQEISERMTKKPTELSPLTMRSRWLLHQRDSTRCGLEGLSCFSFFSRCGS